MAQIIPGINKQLSKIVLGTMVVQMNRKDESFAILDSALENGINTFDTARVYGSENCVGAWVNERGNREDIVIISKGCHPDANGKRVTPEALEEDVKLSLETTGLDYIDMYMFHRDDPDVPVGPLVEKNNELISKGLIRAYGGSNWTHERLKKGNEYAQKNGLIPFTASSPNFGLAEQVDNPWGEGCVTLSGPQQENARAWYIETGMPVFAYSSLARGLFSGRVTRENYTDVCDGAAQKAYCHEVNFRRLDRVRELADDKGFSIAQIALAFVLHSPLNVFPLVGAASPEEVQANKEALDIKLAQEELDYLDLKDKT